MFTEIRTEFAADSPLEGAGFEPSVPLEVLTVGIVPCRLRGPSLSPLRTSFSAREAWKGVLVLDVGGARGNSLNADACHHQDHLRSHPPTDGIRSFHGRVSSLGWCPIRPERCGISVDRSQQA